VGEGQGARAPVSPKTPKTQAVFLRNAGGSGLQNHGVTAWTAIHTYRASPQKRTQTPVMFQLIKSAHRTSVRTASSSMSSCAPYSLLVLVRRATQPSRPSINRATRAMMVALSVVAGVGSVPISPAITATKIDRVRVTVFAGPKLVPGCRRRAGSAAIMVLRMTRHAQAGATSVVPSVPLRLRIIATATAQATTQCAVATAAR